MNKTKEILDGLAFSQWGLFTSAQAEDAGIQRTQIKRMVDDGRIEAIRRGVYRQTGGEESDHIGVKAAWLATNPKCLASKRLKEAEYDTVVSGRTAACLHGVGDFYEEPYEFIVPEAKRTRQKDLFYRKSDIDPKDIVLIDGLPTTSLERTISDLIAQAEDPSQIDDLLQDIARKRMTIDEDELARLLSPLAKKQGFKEHDGVTFARSLIERNMDDQRLPGAYRMLNEYIERSRAIRDSVELNAAANALRELGNSLKALSALNGMELSLPMETRALAASMTPSISEIAKRGDIPLDALGTLQGSSAVQYAMTNFE